MYITENRLVELESSSQRKDQKIDEVQTALIDMSRDNDKLRGEYEAVQAKYHKATEYVP